MKTTNKCHICNKEVEQSKYRGQGPTLCSRECFEDHLWHEHIKRHNSKTVVVDHKRYSIGDEDAPEHFRGFGGNKFSIEFFDGRKCYTTNLWHQGVIPKKFWDQLPDNAKFLNVK